MQSGEMKRGQDNFITISQRVGDHDMESGRLVTRSGALVLQLGKEHADTGDILPFETLGREALAE
jgi:hypothetical protein